MSSDDEIIRHAVGSGCFEYLHKPFSPDQLHAALTRVLAAAPAVSATELQALVPATDDAPGEVSDSGGSDNGDETK
jgi:DNA-binding NarL/FixJ family response regulator